VRQREGKKIGGGGGARAHCRRRNRARVLAEKWSSGELLLPSGGVSGGETKGRTERRSGGFIDGQNLARGLGFCEGRDRTACRGAVLGRGSTER
jgi:hypothetical protein